MERQAGEAWPEGAREVPPPRWEPAAAAPPPYPGWPPAWQAPYPLPYGAPYQYPPWARYDQPPVPGGYPPVPFGAPPFYPASPFPPPCPLMFYPPPGPAYPAAPYLPPPGAPQPYQGPYQGQPTAAARQRKKMGAGAIVIIVLAVLLVVGGAVTAAVLLTSSGGGTYNLGGGRAVGGDIEFTDMVLEQSGNDLTLTGTYNNNTRKSGDAFINVEGTTRGAGQLINFTVPVKANTEKKFTQKQTTASRLSGATLGSIIFEPAYDSGEEESEEVTPEEETSPQPYDMENSVPDFLREGSIPGLDTVPPSPYP